MSYRPWQQIACAAALVAGCQTQAETDYRGEPMAELGGIITSSVDDPPSPLKAVLAWSNTARFGDTFVVEEAVVNAEFPIHFDISLYRPPGDEGLNDYTYGGLRPDEAHIGVAHILALPADLDLSMDWEETGGPTVFGIAEHQLMVYVDRDVLPGTFSAGMLGGELEAGFHLMEVFKLGTHGCTGDFDCMHPSPGDLADPIEIRIDLADLLDFPDWT